MTRIKWKLVLVRLETVLILMQDRCTVCAESSMGSENILDAPDGTGIWRLMWKFVSVRLETVLVSIRLEIVLILT